MVPSFRWFKPLWCHVHKIVENWVSSLKVSSPRLNFVLSFPVVRNSCPKEMWEKWREERWLLKKVVTSSPSIFPVVRNSCTKEIFGASPHISFVQEFLTTGNMEGDNFTTFFRTHLSSLHYSHTSFEQEFLTAGNVKIRKPPSVI